MLYFDHARTSYPKPQCIFDAIQEYHDNIGLPPIEGDFQEAIQARESVRVVRERLAELFAIQKRKHVFFSCNATQVSNMILKSFLQEGDHVILTMYEHNAIVRPLEYLKRTRGITYSVLYPKENGAILPKDIVKEVRSDTKLLISSHIANSTGTVLPIEQMGHIAKECSISFFVDVAQSAGLEDIDVEKCHIDFLVFTGHKYLLGPPGIGGGYVRDSRALEGFIHGGSPRGSSLSLIHPELAPYKFEAGTCNFFAFPALEKSLKYVQEEERYREHIQELTHFFYSELKRRDGVEIYTPKDNMSAFVSFSLKKYFSDEVVHYLIHNHKILIRSGFLCAPFVHDFFSTREKGMNRVSFGFSNSFGDVEKLLMALDELIER